MKKISSFSSAFVQYYFKIYLRLTVLCLMLHLYVPSAHLTCQHLLTGLVFLDVWRDIPNFQCGLASHTGRAPHKTHAQQPHTYTI